MALPTSRSTTYAALSQVKSADLNLIQDCIIDGKHGDRVRNIHVLTGYSIGATAVFGGGAPYIDKVALGTGAFVVPLDFTQGDRIKTITVSVFGNGAADLAVDLRKTPAAVTTASVIAPGPIAVTNPAAAWADVVFNYTDTTIAAGEVFSLHLAPNATGIELGPIRVTYDHP
jgi:hypothetical protein